jgi:hypothetical protein
MRARLAGVVLLAALFGPTTSAAETLTGWFSVSAVEARLGEEPVTTWDVLQFVAWERLAEGRPLGAAPDGRELEAALSRLLYQRILLDAAARQGVAMVDQDRLAVRMDEVLARWGGAVATFEAGTGMRWSRAREEQRRRLLVQRYVQEVVMPSLQVSDREIDAEYARTATAWGDLPMAAVTAGLRRNLTLRALRDELRRTAVRFLERTPITLPGRPFDVEALLSIGGDDSAAALP